MRVFANAALGLVPSTATRGLEQAACCAPGSAHRNEFMLDGASCCGTRKRHLTRKNVF
ncbi:TPA: hypothetical protein ACH3X1_013010 [Trebouxia sp. C0004]